MTLSLVIDGLDQLEDGHPASMALHEHGVVLGRSPQSGWCLPDPTNHISSSHCEIDWRDGAYWLTDTSTNGTALNGETLGRGTTRRLAHGDRLVIGKYRIRIEVTGAPTSRPEAPPSGGPGGIWPAAGLVGSPASVTPSVSAADDGGWATLSPPAGAGIPMVGGGGPGRPMIGSLLDGPRPGPGPDLLPRGPMALGRDERIAYPPPPPEPPSLAPGGRAKDPFAEFMAANDIRWPGAAPAPEPPQPMDDAPIYVPGVSQGPAAGPPVDPGGPMRRTADRPSPGELAWAAFLEMAGVDPADLKADPEDVGATAGMALADLITGLVVMLEARARAKNQLGAPGTSYERDGNNPLKFARDPGRVTTQLLNPPERGFMPTDRAVENAFKDLQAHQMATLAAMQHALRSTLDRFSPRAIRSRAETRGVLAAILPGAKDAALWRAYEREFDGVAHESDEAFLDVFAKAFKRAYEDFSR